MTAGQSVLDGLWDWHSHILSDQLEPPPGATGNWPGVEVSSGAFRLTIGGKAYRDIDAKTFRASLRLADMDATGVAVQVLSPPPYAAAFDGPNDELASLATQQNMFVRDVVAAHPDRFAMFGMLPYRDPDALDAELSRLESAGVAGVYMIAHQDDWLCSRASRDLWNRIADNGWVVFVHPADTAMCDCDLETGATFGAGMPSATGRFATKLLASGLLSEVPRSRVLLAHAGGTLPAMIDRINHGWVLSSNQPNAESPIECARRSIWVDSIAYGRGPLLLAGQVLGEDHLVYGSDYPFRAMMSPADLADVHGGVEILCRVQESGRLLSASHRVADDAVVADPA